ncbi:hypothetical protein [Aporhodopirellula aestuarii]|uniref:Transposase n=1 Tax=Aporhodopirellula aestuarii TaxID=2950107 RepID=A0ABT0U4S5_9BACT|nr:hypothetical protein [Aporhodopirellula aestuarii]MCM2371907.1 hypothetical protein [Aporhodopirellula aestuarii]
MNPDNISPAVRVLTERFDRFRAADMTVAQFCNAEGVIQTAYHYSLKKLHGNQRSAQMPLSNAMPRFVSKSSRASRASCL